MYGHLGTTQKSPKNPRILSIVGSIAYRHPGTTQKSPRNPRILVLQDPLCMGILVQPRIAQKSRDT